MDCVISHIAASSQMNCLKKKKNQGDSKIPVMVFCCPDPSTSWRKYGGMDRAVQVNGLGADSYQKNSHLMMIFFITLFH